MDRVLNAILPRVRAGDGLSVKEISRELTKNHVDLMQSWIGTPDVPGLLSRILMAGMAAGQAAIQHGSAANPSRPMAMKAMNLEVNWSLIPQETHDFIQRYAFNLIQGLDDTTREQVRDILSSWLNTGGSVDDLKQQLTNVFQDAARALSIAQTESTRAYYEGSKKRYQDAGVKRGTWNTVNVGLKRVDKHPGDVCTICSPLHLQEGDLEQGWWSDVLGQYVQPPAHVNCRCWVKPIVDADVIENAPPPKETINTTGGVLPADVGKLGKTIDSLNNFLTNSDGPLARAMRDPEMGLTQIDFDTDQWAVDPAQTKQAAKQFVAESQSIQYSKDYLVTLAQQEAYGNGVIIDKDGAESLYNDFYATRAKAIQAAADIGDVKLTEAQQRRLQQAADGKYLDMVYTTESSLEGSLANQTKRRVTYGGNSYATEAARRDARREMLERFGMLDKSA